MKICVYGGGSLGLVCASVFSSQGHSVSVLTKHPDKWSKTIKSIDLEGKQYIGNLEQITSIEADVIPASDIILLCVPGFLLEEALNNIKNYLRKGSIVGSIVSNTGFFILAHEVLDKETTLFGFQRVPFIARVVEYGKQGNLLGYKSQLSLVIENCDEKENLRKELEKMFVTPIKLLDNFYEVTLTNSNPILHTGRMYAMWKDWEGIPLPNRILFYEDWDKESSTIIIKMDEEFMVLLEKLHVNKNSIPSLLDYYESVDEITLAEKLSTIKAFKGIYAPMVKKDGAWIPDVSSRYFTEDFPFGLRLIYDLCKTNQVYCPNIEKVYKWGIDFIEKYKLK